MKAALKLLLMNLRGWTLVSCLTFLQLAVFWGALQPAPRTPAGATVHKPWKGCTDYKNISTVFINIENPKYNCDSFRYFDDIIASLQPYSDSPIRLGSLGIDQRVGNNFGSEYLDRGKVAVSYDEIHIDWNEATKIVFAHEIGHLILESYLQKEIPVLKKLEAVKQRNALFTKARLQVQLLRQNNPACSGPVMCAEIRNVIDTSPVYIYGPQTDVVLKKFVQENKTELYKLDKVVAGYQELYADLTEALVYSHPAINNQASRLFGIPSESCRTFNEDLPAGFKSTDFHCSLSVIRFQLWNDFVTPNLPDKKLILSKLAKVIQREVSMQMKGKVLSPDAQAQRLILLLLKK